jgi:AcrR family transcriptional regulator
LGPSLVPSDRRAALGYHTQLELVEAAIDLITAGNPRPTIGQVTERAEVSRRTFFNHYRIDGLYGAAAATQVLRARASIGPVPRQGPVAIRIKATCRQRRDVFEQIAIVVHAVQGRPATTPVLDNALEELAALLSDQMNRTFAREISRQSDGSDLTLVLDLATDWDSWISLRFRHHFSAPAAERHLASLMTRLLT